MIINRLNTICLLVVFMNQVVFSQEDCQVPPPVLTSVSVQPETGWVEVEWHTSPSEDIAAYIVYWYSEDNIGWIAIDTIVDPSATRYVYRTSGTKYGIMDFRVAAYRAPLVSGRPGCPSELSNALSTIYLDATADTCNGKIILKWNKYHNEHLIVTGYNILVSENNDPFTEKFNTEASSDEYIITDFRADANYSFFIEADLEDGSVSTSNSDTVSTFMQKPPGWINADFATVTGEGIMLSFTADPSSEISRYNLERKTGTGTWNIITSLNSGNNNISYTDKNSSASVINFYRLSAINGCNLPVRYSDITSNIVLTVVQSSDNLYLEWNQPGRLAGSVLTYDLYSDPGPGFSREIALGTDTACVLKLPDIVYEVTGRNVCFYVLASEENNPYGINSVIRSSVACYSPEEKITVPNLFTPNGDLRNDLFSPVLSFTPVDYLLLVTDRQGKVLFETRDYLEKWDGSFNGAGQDDGVYLWHVRITCPSGKKISKTGTVTIVH